MALRAFIAVEIVAHLVAERDDPENLLLGRQIAALARIEILHRAAQFGKIGTDPAGFVHRPDRTVQKAVGLARCLGDFLAAHIGNLVHFFAKFGTVFVLGDQIIDKTVDFFFQFGLYLVTNGDKAAGLLGCDRNDRIGRGQFQVVGRGDCFGRHALQPPCPGTSAGLSL